MSNNIGERNRLLRIMRRSTGRDAANQPIKGLEFVMRRWGKPVTATGMASVRASMEGVPATPVRYSWRINYTPVGIDAGMFAQHGGVTYNIQEVRHDHAGRNYTDLVCETGGSNG